MTKLLLYFYQQQRILALINALYTFNPHKTQLCHFALYYFLYFLHFECDLVMWRMGVEPRMNIWWEPHVARTG